MTSTLVDVREPRVARLPTSLWSDQTLKLLLGRLDEMIETGEHLTEDLVDSVLIACAWAHAEWVRIHPFINGSGRTARLLANAIAMRYFIPPFVSLRPRPSAGYGEAAAEAMTGNWRPTYGVFQQLLADVLAAPQGDAGL